MTHRKCKNISREFFLAHPVLNNHVSLLQFIKQSFQPDDDIWFIKAPGRVNLIGEHTDYNMGPVLPCAIDREIVICVRKNNSGYVNVLNTVPTFENLHFSLMAPIRPYPLGHWGNYLKAGINGLLENFQHFAEYNARLCGFDAIVSSTLPVAAGISSSSALVVASALSLLAVNHFELDKLKLAEICAEAEHFVGTAGGGMDQAASLMGKKDSFLKIEFNPLRVKTISAPEKIFLILFHSLQEAEKSQSVRKEYNRRVFECQAGVDLFNKFMSVRLSRNFTPVRFIGEIQPDSFKLSDNELNRLTGLFVDELKVSYTLDELADNLDVPGKILNERYRTILKDNQAGEPADGFKLKGRFQHVFSECRRVDEMITCLENSDIFGMGRLLNASHRSLAQNYEVSTPEVDELIDRLMSLNVPGARLMGAGFGGMILTLTERNLKDDIVNHLKETFYQHRLQGKIDDYIIPCVTSDGAGTI